jgi:DNA repair photolyase
MAFYKYYSAITSQIGFCSTPLRLDSYNRCQFGCTYCFANTRQGFGRNSNLKISNPKALRDRIKRVISGNISSALDEFIENRIPFQLGGMSDPFMKTESNKKITLEYLKILKEYDYPVIISTKSDLVSEGKYLEILSDSNSYVRFSTTVVDSQFRTEVDQGCPSIDKIVSSAKILINQGIPVSFRLQPIIPGHEYAAYILLDLADEIGVKHISAEYLKVPIDANIKFGKGIKDLLDGNPIAAYKTLGATRHGREYNLPLSYRRNYLIKMALYTKDLGMTFGFSDNDLLMHSDGDSCCNASNLYLNGANYFDANIVSIAKKKNALDRLTFSDYLNTWIPKEAISTYLNSKARINICNKDQPDWLLYLKQMWIGKHGVYSPDYFDGIDKTLDQDENGLPIYIRNASDFEQAYYMAKECSSTYNKTLKLTLDRALFSLPLQSVAIKRSLA